MDETTKTLEITTLPAEKLKAEFFKIEDMMNQLLENAQLRQISKDESENLIQSETEIFSIRTRLLNFRELISLGNVPEIEMIQKYQKFCKWYHRFEKDLVKRYQDQENTFLLEVENENKRLLDSKKT